MPDETNKIVPVDELENEPSGEATRDEARRTDPVNEIADAFVGRYLESEGKILSTEARETVNAKMAKKLADDLENLPVLVAMAEAHAESPQELENLKFLQGLDERFEEAIQIEVDSNDQPFARIAPTETIHGPQQYRNYIVHQSGVYILGVSATREMVESMDVAAFLAGVQETVHEDRGWKTVTSIPGLPTHVAISARQISLGNRASMQDLGKSLEALKAETVQTVRDAEESSRENTAANALKFLD